MRGARLVLLFVAVLAVALGAGLYQRNSSDSSEQSRVSNAATNNTSASEDAKDGLGQKLDSEPSRKLANVGTPDTMFWVEVDPARVTAIPARRENVADQRLLAFDRAALLALKYGDQFDVLIPHIESNVTIWVDEARRLPTGNYSVVGHVDGDLRFGVVLTVGEASLFGKIGTEAGVFNIRGGDTHAWIVPSRSLDSHVDYSKSDTRVDSVRKDLSGNTRRE